MESETVPAPAGMEVDGGGLGLMAHRQQLLPGFPDDETFVNIVPKLPWKCIDSLASERSAWLHAVRSRKVYDGRVAYRAVEPLVLLRYDFEYHMLGLYSTRDGFYFDLPSLPVCEGGIPDDCECVTLDGKVYVLGGKHLDFLHVYVLDLAGRRQWKQCASMLRQKMCCGSVALDGKVYIVGSTFRGVRFTEVYDPKADIWSLIGPMELGEEVQLGVREEEVIYRYRQGGLQQLNAREYAQAVREEVMLRERDHFLLSSVQAVGEELFVISEDSDDDETQISFMANVYDRVKEEWRVEELFPRLDHSKAFSSTLFTAQGELHRMQDGCIFVLDMDTKTWMLRHSYSIFGMELDQYAVITVGDELLALVAVGSEFQLLRSEGFGGKNVHMTWHICELCPSYHIENCSEMYAIEL